MIQWCEVQTTGVEITVVRTSVVQTTIFQTTIVQTTVVQTTVVQTTVVQMTIVLKAYSVGWRNGRAICVKVKKLFLVELSQLCSSVVRESAQKAERCCNRNDH